MGNIQNFEDWKNASNLDEGLGSLIKSFFKSLSAPVKKKLDIVTKNINTKTGEVLNSKTLGNDLLSTFKEIANDKKADLKGVDSMDDVKVALKDFIKEIKTVFVAAKVPFTAMVESEEVEYTESLNEDLKADFSMIMKDTQMSEEDFDEYLDTFLDDWIEKNGGGDEASASKAASKFIDTMMTTFEKKLKAFGPNRLKKLIELTMKDPKAKKEDIQKIINSDDDGGEEEKPGTEIIEDSETVQTPEGKKQFAQAIMDDSSELTFFKYKNEDGTFDVIVKNVKI